MSSTATHGWGTGIQHPDQEVRTALRLVCEAVKRHGVTPDTARLRREAIRIAHDGGLTPQVIRTITGMSTVSIHRILEGN